MRLLCTLNEEAKAKELSDYLKYHGIDNSCEVEVNRDWGSPDYGTILCKVWVVEEDQFASAQELLEKYEENPAVQKQLFEAIKKTPIPVQPSLPQDENALYSKAKKNLITVYLLIFCCLLFFISELTTPHVPTTLPALPLSPLLSSPVKDIFLFDFPSAFEYVRKLVHLYGIDNLENLNSLPSEGQYYLQQIKTHPYWQGLYDKLVSYSIKPSQTVIFDAPLFEKIRRGEVWRLFTPILLHGDLFHLLFNMLWLYVLGKQIEERIGSLRYILFILAAAALSNCVQYLMSGPNFIGFSGVLCAMLTFIWVRQRKTPWEGYQLQNATFVFIMIFVFGMLGMQMLAFFLEIYTHQRLPIAIANAAHIAGLIIGLFLGQLNFFARRA